MSLSLGILRTVYIFSPLTPSLSPFFSEPLATQAYFLLPAGFFCSLLPYVGSQLYVGFPDLSCHFTWGPKVCLLSQHMWLIKTRCQATRNSQNQSEQILFVTLVKSCGFFFLFQLCMFFFFYLYFTMSKIPPYFMKDVFVKHFVKMFFRGGLYISSLPYCWSWVYSYFSVKFSLQGNLCAKCIYNAY